MNPSLQTIGCALTMTLLFATQVPAQLVTVRTAPVSVAEQFYTFPSERLGMGGSLALRDYEADPFATRPILAQPLHVRHDRPEVRHQLDRGEWVLREAGCTPHGGSAVSG